MLDVLVNCPQWGPENALKCTSLFVAQSADVRIHGVDTKSCKRLRPLVSKLIQANESLTTRGGILSKLEAVPVVIVAHPVLPPIHQNLLSATRANDPLKVRSAVEKLNLVGKLDLNLIGLRCDGLEQFESDIVSLRIRHEIRILWNERYPVVRHGEVICGT